jgi:hypothetical protein
MLRADMLRAVCLSLVPAILAAQSSVLVSRKAATDVEVTADPDSLLWRSVQGIVMESDYFGVPVPKHRTHVKSRWTPGHLYLLFECHYEELNLRPDPSTKAETPRLWNWDVAEAFIGSDAANIGRYREFQISPQGEWIDLDIDRTGQRRGGGAAWDSGIKVKARIDASHHIWYGEMKIPFEAISDAPPRAGTELRAGFFRIAGRDAEKKKISWQATGATTFHVPEKFGILRLTD